MSRPNRVKAMCELDIATARKMSPSTNISDDMVLAGLHKARCVVADAFEEITPAMVKESTEWLEERGMKAGF